MIGLEPKQVKLSYSALSQATCLYRYHLRYVRKVEKIYPSTPLQIGSYVHAGMAAYNLSGSIPEGKRAIIKAFRLWRFQTTPEGELMLEGLQNLEDAKVIFERTVAHQTLENWEVVKVVHQGMATLAVELKLDIPLRNWKGFTGYCDVVVRDPSGALWLVDYKTREALQQDETEEFNIQLALYQYMLKQQFGLDIGGTVTFQIRREVPRQPTLNKPNKKTGIRTMSRAKCATDWPTYKAALIANGLDPAEYAGMQEQLEGREYFRLSKIYRSPQTLKTIWDTVQRQAWNISATKHPTRNMTGTHCRSCWAKEWCIGELTNPNFEGLPELYNIKKG